MDRDSFVGRHIDGWDRLDELSRRTDLTAAQADELVRLYLRASSHLATARRRYDDPSLLLRLNQVVARANARVHGTRSRTLRGLRIACTRTFPAAIWHNRRPVMLAAALFLVVAAATGIWIATSPAALDVAIPPTVREAYVGQQFANYYSAQPASQFAASVFTNNARVGVLAFAAGIAAGIPTLLVVAFNASHLGVAAGAFHAAGRAPLFWGLVLPHGLLELTAVFVAAGAGMALGWALVAPGDRTRAAALAQEARRAVVIVLGLVVVFLVAGLIEAFITPSPLPTWARVGTGVVIECAFIAYVVGFGRAAAAQGWTGAADEGRRRHAYSRPVALTSR